MISQSVFCWSCYTFRQCSECFKMHIYYRYICLQELVPQWWKHAGPRLGPRCCLPQLYLPTFQVVVPYPCDDHQATYSCCGITPATRAMADKLPHSLPSVPISTKRPGSMRTLSPWSNLSLTPKCSLAALDCSGERSSFASQIEILFGLFFSIGLRPRHVIVKCLSV